MNKRTDQSWAEVFRAESNTPIIVGRRGVRRLGHLPNADQQANRMRGGAE